MQLSKALQAVQCDLAETCEHINDILTVMIKWREDAETEFKQLFEVATELAMEVETGINISRAHLRQLKKENLETE